MASNKVFHNVLKVSDAATEPAEIAQSADNSGFDSYIWHDITGWVDLVVAYDFDAGSGDTNVDANILMHTSSHGAYELNNSITEDTGDYIAISIVDNETTKTYIRVDADDIDDLKHPIRSVRFLIENDDANENLVANVWLEGWS